MSDIGTQIVTIILESVGSLMVALICLGLKHLISWLKTKTKSQKLQIALDDLNNCIEEGVFYVEQELVKTYKEKGTWDEQAKKEVKTACLNYVEKILDTATKDLLPEDPVDRARLLSAKIEATLGKIHANKQEGQS